MNEADGDGGTHTRRRLRGFGAHLLAYFAVMAGLIGASVFFLPGKPLVPSSTIGWYV